MKIHGPNDGIENSHVGPSGIPADDPLQLLFGNPRSLKFGDQEPPAQSGPRNMFLKGRAPVHKPVTESKSFKPPFETPDFSSEFSEKISKIIRP